jgi:hypothetical protein
VDLLSSIRGEKDGLELHRDPLGSLWRVSLIVVLSGGCHILGSSIKKECVVKCRIVRGKVKS